jgi:alpha-L-fucosidase
VNPDLWWFDGDWTRTALQWKMKELRDEMLSWNPKTILNSRMEDGTFTQPQIDRLKGLGRWTNKHAEAIYGTTSGLPFGHFYGPTTLSKDRKTIYCFVLDTPKDDIVLKGVRNKIKQVRLVGTTENLSFKRNGGAIENN